LSAIGVFGGTFDPVHYGHLRVAWECMELAGLERVHMIPAATPPHRRPPEADGATRAALLRAALAGQSRLVLDERELRRGGVSYMVDTLGELRAELPRTPLCLIVGTDAFLGLESWHRWARRIRRLIRQGREPRYLIPEQVWNSIERHGLYGHRKTS